MTAPAPIFGSTAFSGGSGFAGLASGTFALSGSETAAPDGETAGEWHLGLLMSSPCNTRGRRLRAIQRPATGWSVTSPLILPTFLERPVLMCFMSFWLPGAEQQEEDFQPTTEFQPIVQLQEVETTTAKKTNEWWLTCTSALQRCHTSSAWNACVFANKKNTSLTGPRLRLHLQQVQAVPIRQRVERMEGARHRADQALGEQGEQKDQVAHAAGEDAKNPSKPHRCGPCIHMSALGILRLPGTISKCACACVCSHARDKAAGAHWKREGVGLVHRRLCRRIAESGALLHAIFLAGP